MKFIRKYEFLLPVFLFILFCAVTIPGISWGAPDIWNPDELFARVDKALAGKWEFDETNLDYPSLPKYVMFGIGKVVYALGYSTSEFLIAARLVSVLLGGSVVVLTYLIARNVKAEIIPSTLAALLVFSSSELVHNAQFAHNDLYLLFFVTLSLYCLIKYRQAGSRLWLYGAFLFVGMAASSKYNGGVFLLAVVLTFFIVEGRAIYKDFIRSAETFALGIILCFLGYALGTPKALLWMSYYTKRLLPMLVYISAYGKDGDNTIGLYGQWTTFRSAVGEPVYYLFLFVVLWYGAVWVLKTWKNVQVGKDRLRLVLILVIAILVFDYPIMVSYNYQARFFLGLIPMLAILSALWVDDLMHIIQKWDIPYLRMVVMLLMGITIGWSMLRVVSVKLLFYNDARIPASEFVAGLPAGASLEHTFYSPSIPQDHFEREHNYPVFFPKVPGQEIPTPGPNKPFKAYNEGEAGLDERETDYLVIDSFTYDRFENQYICETNRLECDFFKALRSGKTGYRQITSYSYSLPSYLPQIEISFVNPDIEIYERIRD
ncbi:MAG: phospholipid carrier-dependent glycosyltransferase [Anaerolineales bacterium]|nr:phospholipid carrier-dependent glycosyltransferase [Anaerolineales bacterium]